jgi:hypothetical protein
MFILNRDKEGCEVTVAGETAETLREETRNGLTTFSSTEKSDVVFLDEVAEITQRACFRQVEELFP